MAWTWESTFHCIQTAAAGVAALAGVPVVAGWLVHVTPFSVHAALLRTTSSVRPETGDLLERRSVAPVTEQPAGTVGKENCASARVFRLGLFDVTLRTESVPLLADGAACSTQESAL